MSDLETSSFEPQHGFEHLDKLSYEIGPRLAGSEGERRAADYIKKHLKDCGLWVRTQRFWLVDRVVRDRISALVLAGIFVASFFLGPVEALLAVGSGLSLIMILPRIMPKNRSQNIIGSLKPEKPKRRIVLSAHYDSAQCIRDRRWMIYLRVVLPILLSTFLILLILRFFGWGPAWWISWTILGAFFLPTCAVPFFAYENLVSPGGNDNASGVAIMLEAARVASKFTLGGNELWFVAFGGEEQGLCGSKEFFFRSARPTFLVNLDSLGAGTYLSIIQGNGVLKRHRTSPKLNEMVKEKARGLGFEIDSIWSPFSIQDHLPFVEGRADATTLTSYESRRKNKLDRFLEKILGLPHVQTERYSNIHTLEDVPEEIKLDNVSKAGKLVLKLLKIEGDNS